MLMVVALGALGALLVGTPYSTRRRRRVGGGPRPGRRRVVARPSWVREAPVGAAEAERRSLALLRSVVNADEWDMFDDLGFICVAGRRTRRGPGGQLVLTRYRYLIYPHLPVVALLPRSFAPVREYCVQFPGCDGDGQPAPLPLGDDVLAKWMTLRADEDRLLSYASVAHAGCQVPLGRIERDLERLARWSARREASEARAARGVTEPLRRVAGRPDPHDRRRDPTAAAAPRR